MFAHTITDAGLTRAFTDRRGGVSSAPFAELNLGDHVGDDPAAVATNRARLAAALGLDVSALSFMHQLHGTAVAQVTTSDQATPSDRDGPAPHADALVSAAPEVALVVLVADCIPVLLWDDATGVIAAAHAGRPGLRAGVLPATVAAMRDLGAREIHALLGPSVCGRCYEVPAQMQADVARVVPATRVTTRQGTPGLDLAAGALAQLAALDVRADAVAECTAETGSLFSYRRERRTGRCAGVIVRRAG
ncbi:MAG: peptidoglycan editing factor PgeF [Tetrasphaera sp.]